MVWNHRYRIASVGVAFSVGVRIADMTHVDIPHHHDLYLHLARASFAWWHVRMPSLYQCFQRQDFCILRGLNRFEFGAIPRLSHGDELDYIFGASYVEPAM